MPFLRHTALTHLGDAAGGDIFALARIAGHSTIAVTQRYIHPQADAINRVFAMRGGHKIGHNQKSKEDRTAKKSRSGYGISPVLCSRKMVPGVGVEPT
jgi:hypothetical protein